MGEYRRIYQRLFMQVKKIKETKKLKKNLKLGRNKLNQKLTIWKKAN